MLNRERLVAPASDGGVLLEPPMPHLLRTAERSAEIFRGAAVSLLGRDLAEVRAEARRQWAGESSGPVWVLGHQPEFMHVGVWFKHVVADRLARRTSGVAVNLVVDNDEPKSSALRTVRVDDGRPVVTDVPIPTARPARPFEQWPAMNAEQVASFGEAVRAGMGEAFGRSTMPTVLSGFGEADAESGFVGQMIAGRRRIDAIAGVSLVERRVSEAWGGPLLGQIIVDAERFAAAYNQALAAYRRAHGIKGTTRPVPDLASAGGRVELPLWTYRPDGARRRVFVALRGDAFTLFADVEPVATLSRREIEQWCARDPRLAPGTDYAVRPRALSLTLWARLVLGDVFIHGIGGAKYDEMTDDLMRRYFGVEPPPMVCASATLRLPAATVTPDVTGAARRLRDWTFNPHRVAHDASALAPMLTERAALIERSRRLRDASPKAHAVRHEVFGAIRSVNERMRGREPSTAERLRAALAEAVTAARHSRALASREYFAGMFPAERLASLAAKVDAVIGA